MKKCLFVLFFLLPAFVFGGQLNVLVDGQYRPLPMTKCDITVTIFNQMAYTCVKQTFSNPYSESLKGIYSLRKPPESQITSFAATLGNERREGKIFPRHQAKEIFRKESAEGRITSLVEYTGEDDFTVYLSPILPGSAPRIELVYRQILACDQQRISYFLPTSQIKESLDFKCQVNIQSIVPIVKTEWEQFSRMNPSEDKNPEGHHVKASFWLQNERLPEYLSFSYFTSREKSKFYASFHKGKESPYGYWMVVVPPGLEKEEVQPRDFTFLLDVSASMRDSKWKSSVEAITECLNHLQENDRFNLIAFNTGVETNTGMMPASEINKIRAVRMISALKAQRSFNLESALAYALKEAPDAPERPHYILLISDGRPLSGSCTALEIASAFPRWPSHTRLCVFVLGHHFNRLFIKTLSSLGQGDWSHVLNPAYLRETMVRFLEKVSRPVFTNVHLTVQGIETSEVYPASIGPLFSGKQMVLTGRYRGQGKAVIELSGYQGKELKKHTLACDFPEEEMRHSELKTLWAIQRINGLLERLELKEKEEESLRQEIISLALEYQIVTPYTSFLMVESPRILEKYQDIVDSLALPSRDIASQKGMEPERKKSMMAEQKAASSDQNLPPPRPFMPSPSKPKPPGEEGGNDHRKDNIPRIAMAEKKSDDMPSMKPDVPQRDDQKPGTIPAEEEKGKKEIVIQETPPKFEEVPEFHADADAKPKEIADEFSANETYSDEMNQRHDLLSEAEKKSRIKSKPGTISPASSRATALILEQSAQGNWGSEESSLPTALALLALTESREEEARYAIQKGLGYLETKCPWKKWTGSKNEEWLRKVLLYSIVVIRLAHTIELEKANRMGMECVQWLNGKAAPLARKIKSDPTAKLYSGLLCRYANDWKPGLLELIVERSGKTFEDQVLRSLLDKKLPDFPAPQAHSTLEAYVAVLAYSIHHPSYARSLKSLSPLSFEDRVFSLLYEKLSPQ